MKKVEQMEQTASQPPAQDANRPAFNPQNKPYVSRGPVICYICGQEGNYARNVMVKTRPNQRQQLRQLHQL